MRTSSIPSHRNLLSRITFSRSVCREAAAPTITILCVYGSETVNIIYVLQFLAMAAQCWPKESDCQCLTQPHIYTQRSSSIASVLVIRQRAPPLGSSAVWRTSAESTATGEGYGAGKETVIIANDEVREFVVERRQRRYALQVVEQVGDELVKRHRSKTQPTHSTQRLRLCGSSTLATIKCRRATKCCRATNCRRRLRRQCGRDKVS